MGIEPGSEVLGSGLSPSAGLKSGQKIQIRNSEKANVECRMSNVEGMYSVYFIKMTERNETTIIGISPGFRVYAFLRSK